MFSLRTLASLLIVIATASAAPLRLSRAPSRSSVIMTRQASSLCKMDTSMMSYNLAGAMVSMTAVQSQVNDTMVQAVQEGIMGAIMALTMLNGGLANDATIPSYVPGAMVGNITTSLNYIDTITGVPSVDASANLDAAQQQLQNAGQFAMQIPASCLNTNPDSPASASARPSASTTATVASSSAPSAA